MRLWTMQTPDIELTRYAVDHRRSPWIATFPEYAELCKTLSEQLELGTDQFIWCLTEDEETWKNRVKWELIVPEDHVHLICSITWYWILTRSVGGSIGCAPPEELFDLCRWLNPCYTRDDFFKQFHGGWRYKTTKELWGMLEVNGTENSCTQALALLPIEEGWISRRPS